MANGTVDSLNIQISASASQAEKSLESLASSLQKLNKTFGSINSSGLSTFTKNLGKITSAFSGISKININDSGINKTINALKRLADATAKEGFKSEAFTQIAESMRVLSDIPDVSNSLNRFISSIARLASAGSKTSQSASGIYKLGQETRKAISELSGIGNISADVNMFVQSIGRLASAGNKTSQTASGLDDLSKATISFFNSMKEAPEISQNTLQMVQALAQLSSSGSNVGKTTSSISSALSNLSGTASRAGSVVSSAFGRIKSAISGLGNSDKKINKVSISIGSMIQNALVFRATDAISQFGYNMFDLGSAITEVENVVDVAFGSMASKAYDFAETATEQFGLSELAAKQYSGTMMAMLNSSGVAQDAAAEMSTTLASLAGDLASFYNIGTDEAWQKIMSGISGEIEPLRRLGINLSVANLQSYALSQGITKSWQSMTQAEQVMIRYNYLMQATSAQSGDFARTSGRMCAA